MAKKADLEAGYSRCGDLSHRALRDAKAHDYRSALALAVKALPELTHALNYQRRFLKPDRIKLPPADLILRYAPPLFAGATLDALAMWADGLSRVERQAVPDMPGRVADGRLRLADAVRLWSTVDRIEPTKRSPPQLIEAWLNAGLIVPADGYTPGYRLVTDLRRPSPAKCPHCGQVVRMALITLLDPMSCPVCKRTGTFVRVVASEGPA